MKILRPMMIGSATTVSNVYFISPLISLENARKSSTEFDPLHYKITRYCPAKLCCFNFNNNNYNLIIRRISIAEALFSSRSSFLFSFIKKITFIFPLRS